MEARDARNIRDRSSLCVGKTQGMHIVMDDEQGEPEHVARWVGASFTEGVSSVFGAPGMVHGVHPTR